MFIQVKKGVFEPEVEEQINRAFQDIDDTISNIDAPSVDEKVKLKPLSIDGAIENYSVIIGNEIVLFMKIKDTVSNPYPPVYDFQTFMINEKNEVQTVTVSKTISPPYDFEGWLYCSYVLPFIM